MQKSYGIIPLVILLDRSNIEKIAQNQEDKLLLAKVWDKIQSGIRKNIVSYSCFLSPRQLEMTHYLFGNLKGLHSFGGYPEAERKMLIYLPEYLEEDFLVTEDSPLVCLRATFYEADMPSHRDFLGALMGNGIAREAVGDICVGKCSCDFFVSVEIAPYILQNFTSAGRAKLHLQSIALNEAQIPQPQVQEIRDTVASLRLDSIISSGFCISRGIAAQYIDAGKVSINGLPIEKAEKAVPDGAKISVRGLGKIQLKSVNGQTKKGRISVMIDRYI